jgi:two-component system chemotaxis response regulator CheB
MTQPSLQVLIVDDSAIYRRILTKVLAAIPDVSVAGTATNGREAIAFLKDTPVDLVLLDLEMPELNGLETLEILTREYRDTAVLMVSGVGDARKTMRALSLGAIDFVPKPEGGDTDALRQYLERGVRVVHSRRLARAHRRATTAVRAPSAAELAAPRIHQVAARAAQQSDARGLILIGVSTGGPVALERLVPALPGDLALPVLIVQHMPRGFAESLAESLARKSQLVVSEAKDGDSATPGRVLIAPGGRHMEVTAPSNLASAPRIRIHDGPLRNECRPAVDVLFESVASWCSSRVLAVVLTGMGTDGCDGVRALRARGASCVVQDEDSSVVYGMPRAVVEAGLSDAALPLSDIPKRIIAFAAGIS